MSHLEHKPIMFYSYQMLLRSLIFILAVWMPLSLSAELKNGRYFQAITTDSAITNTLWYMDGEEQQSIHVTKLLRSAEYGYQEAPFITFYGKRLNAEGEPLPEAIAKIPEGASRLLLIFSPVREQNAQGLSYNVHVLRDDLDRFAFGSFQFINVSNKKVAIDLQGNRFMLERGAFKVLKMKPPERGDLSIRIAAQGDDGAWQSNYINGWSHRSDLRTLAFIIDGPNDRVKTLRYRQTEPKQ